jgi:hypothetical protein
MGSFGESFLLFALTGLHAGAILAVLLAKTPLTSCPALAISLIAGFVLAAVECALAEAWMKRRNRRRAQRRG